LRGDSRTGKKGRSIPGSVEAGGENRDRARKRGRKAKRLRQQSRFKAVKGKTDFHKSPETTG